MARAPQYVRDFLKAVPSVWDDVKLIDGFPGKYVVLARRAGDVWYVAGINAEKALRSLSLDLGSLAVRHGTLITDGHGGNLSFEREAVSADKPLEITLAPRGGFVLTAE